MSARIIRPAIAAALLSLAGLGLILFVPPPAGVLRRMVVATSDSLMDGPAPQEGPVKSMAKRLLRGYVQISFASRLAKSAGTASRGGDEEILARMMGSARQLVLKPPSNSEIRYDPSFWPALVSGVGYCDQINGAVCLIAANHFEKPQLFALYDAAQHSSPHTVGRVWSKEHRDWLYFDAFCSVPVIYLRGKDGKAHFLFEGRSTSKRSAAQRDLYDLPGWTISEFSSSFGGYVMTRLLQTRSKPLPGVVLDQKVSSHPPPPMERRRDDVYRRISRAYVDVRVEHLLGDPDPAAYLAVASDETAATDDRAAELAAAAQRFADGQ